MNCNNLSLLGTRRCLAFALSLGLLTSLNVAAGNLEYNRDVRPILAENCFPCHGTDSAARKAKLRLDSFAEATADRGGDPRAIVPGKPDKSEMIRRIFDEGDDLMPPEASHKVLSAAQKRILKRWVSEGAKYQPHWAFVSPVRPTPPAVKNLKWVRNPVDQFILARLEAEKLKPAPEADRRTLARRLSFDLTGLPPAPESVEKFLNDNSPDAYERYVDSLMASPHWGEHRGRYWLDAARYGDTHGIHFDNFREMWTYRDRIIKAFNDNERFDQFTIEQLAGDLLPDATRDQKIASGFNRCNITTSEGGAIDDEYLVLYARDRTETTSQVWMGLTAGCAVCHDHKYDPLSQKEFYQLSAYFNNTTQRAMDGNVKDTPPVIVVPLAKDESRWKALDSELPPAEKKVNDRKKSAREDYATWLKSPAVTEDMGKMPTNGLVFRAFLDEGITTNVSATVAGAVQSVGFEVEAQSTPGVVAPTAFVTSGKTMPTFQSVADFERTNAFSWTAWVKMPEGENRTGALFARMANESPHTGWDFWIEGEKPAFHLISEWAGNAIKVIGKNMLPKGKWVHVAMTYDGSSKAGGVKLFVNGESQDLTRDKDSLKGSTRTKVPFRIGGREGGARVSEAGLQDVQIFNRQLSAADVRRLGTLARLDYFVSIPPDKQTTNEVEELYSVWLETLDKPYRDLAASRDRLAKEKNGIRTRATVAHIMSEREQPAEAFLLNRGEYDQRRDKVSPATPAALPAMPSGLPANRLGLAQWLLRPEHPLTARVTVNRFWQEIFGEGLVRTAGDFGIAGEMPSHPELLDWLAVEFREGGWDMKRFFKLLVTSAAYRQSALTTRDKIARDPQNRLLARGPRFRMDAEMIRDNALAVSGLLVPKIGGPSVKPYQPEGVWEAVAMPESDTRRYKQDSGEALYRRSLYTFWKRSAPPASMDILNAPSRQVCTVRRERTDTPLQALVTLNDPQFVEAARHLAQLALTQGGQKPESRLDFMAERLIARPLKDAEKKIVTAGLTGLLTHYGQSPEEAEKLLAVGDSKPDTTLDKPTLAAYTMLANQLMNLDEVLTK
jgi:cytochrome c553